FSCMLLFVFPCPLASVSVTPYRAHLALPSFPTRRSSDLGDGGLRLRRNWNRWHWTGFLALLICAAGLAHLVVAHYSHVWSVATEDRKSTRLNSSHEWISYAVFCLKKKTATPLQ